MYRGVFVRLAVAGFLPSDLAFLGAGASAATVSSVTRFDSSFRLAWIFSAVAAALLRFGRERESGSSDMGG